MGTTKSSSPACQLRPGSSSGRTPMGEPAAEKESRFESIEVDSRPQLAGCCHLLPTSTWGLCAWARWWRRLWMPPVLQAAAAVAVVLRALLAQLAIVVRSAASRSIAWRAQNRCVRTERHTPPSRRGSGGSACSSTPSRHERTSTLVTPAIKLHSLQHVVWYGGLAS